MACRLGSMTVRLGILLLSGVLSTACVRTTTQTRYVSDGERPVLVAPKANASTLDARVAFEQGLVKGHLSWSNRCRTGVEALSHEDVFEVRTPNRGAGVAAILVGGLVSVASGAVLSNADTLSNVETCGTNINGDYSCSSPRQDATGWGIGGIVTGVGLGVTGLATFGMRTTSKPMEPIPHPAVLAKVTEQTVACGKGPVVGFGVALTRGSERLAASSTNSDGDFALVVPARTTGPMTLVIDSVPWGTELTRANELLATIDIPAAAESNNPAESATTSAEQ
ncbi:MAG TPA: hypothetical protein VIV60_05880 [Polyangiaceae bacterium]